VQASIVSPSSSSITRRWFQIVKPVPHPRLRLVCFPHAGGSASTYRLWPAALPADVEVWSVKLPGRAARMAEPPMVSMEALLEQLTSAIPPLFDRPFDFFGHSMGTVAAFELTRRLRQLGAPLPSRLFLSGRRAPHVGEPNPLIHTLSHDALVERLRRMGGTSEAIFNEPDLLAMFLPALRADLQAVETWTYRDEAPLDVPIVAAGGLDDALAGESALEGWRQHTSAGFELHRFPGGHFYLHEGPELLALLHRTLTSE
jgi:medium-chain acyl-[acyl-carrier-protein] hydrolase